MSVVAVLQLPPPTTGLSAVNARVVRALAKESMLVGSADLSPPIRGSRTWKLFVRGVRALRACVVLIVSRSRGGKTLYMPSDAAAGIVINVLLMMIGRVLGYKIIVHHHNFSYVNSYSGLMNVFLLLCPESTFHVFLCEKMHHSMAAMYSSAWVGRRHAGMVLSNAFMIDRVERVESIREELVIGHLSNLCVEKGSVRFVELFSALRSQGVKVKAKLAGPIGDEQVRGAIQKASQAYPDSFEWIGPVYGEAKSDFYASIDVFVFPSQYVNEAQPLVLLEAMAHGAAIIATGLGCTDCDHRESPGVIASDFEFDALAVNWLARKSITKERDHTRKQAILQFEQKKQKAEAEFEELIAMARE